MRRHSNPIQYPFPSGINPLLSEAEQQNMEWSATFGFTSTEALKHWNEKNRFAWFLARSFPNADLTSLCIGINFMTWVVLMDDIFDKTSGDAARYKILESQAQDIIAYLTEGKDSGHEVLFKSGLKDVLQRFSAFTDNDWQYRFRMSIVDLLQESLWEAHNQVIGHMPTYEEYFEKRPSSAMWPQILMIEALNHIHLPPAVMNLPIIKEMEWQINMLLNLGNDLDSLEYEENVNLEGLNLLFILRRDQHKSYEEAENIILTLHQEMMDKFLYNKKNLPSFDEETDKELLRYITELTIYIKGYHDWANIDSGRYD